MKYWLIRIVEIMNVHFAYVWQNELSRLFEINFVNMFQKRFNVVNIMSQSSFILSFVVLNFSSTIIVFYFLFVQFLFMISRKTLKKLCKSDDLNQNRSNTIYDVFQIIFDRFFIDLSIRIFQHTNQHDRDIILRVLSFNVAHFEFDKLFCFVQDKDVIQIFNTLIFIEFEKKCKRKYTRRTKNFILFSQFF